MSIVLVMPSSRLILWHPLLFLLSIFPSIRDFPVSWLFTSDEQNTVASALASVLPRNIRVDFPWDWLVWSLCCPRNFQESSPAAQFKSINSLAFYFLYGPALTTVRDHWEDHSLDCMDLCQQSNVSAFQHIVLVCHSFPAKKQLSSYFMTSVTICSDFWISRRGNLSLLPPFPLLFALR